jgi:hypothetical protein
MENFTKVVRLGTAKTYDGHAFSIYCKIEYCNGRLSIFGVEGPTRGGNAIGGCGQIVTHLLEKDAFREITPAPGWTMEAVERFLKTWDRWHLNDMQAGSPAQMAHLRKLSDEGDKHRSDYYGWATTVLGAAGLNPDPNYLHNHKPYRYGHARLREDVPDDVLEFLRALPDTDIQPAWV